MDHIFSIFKFKTPFFSLEQEKTNLEKLYEKTKEFLDFQWILYKVTIKNDDFFKNYHFVCDDFLFIISVSKNINTYHLPLIKFYLYSSKSFYLSHNIHYFCSLYFEIFDGLREKSFLLDINKEILTFDALQYDFATFDSFIEKYKSQKEIYTFLKKYISWKTQIWQKDFLQIEEIFLYFLYLVYNMFQNLSELQTQKAKNKTILETQKTNELLIKNLELSQNRLSHMEDMSMVAFKKYITMLDAFYKLFI